MRAQRLPRRASSGGVSGAVYPVRRAAAGNRNTLSNWYPGRIDNFLEERDRKLVGLRAEDLVASDPHAASLVDSITINTVGVGLTPQSRVDAKRLGLTDDQASAYQASAERVWKTWCREADAGRRMSFGSIQYLAVRSMLEHGEYLFLPLMLDRPGRTFSLALQDVHPARLATPSDKTGDTSVRAGVSLGPCREPVGYYIANPRDGLLSSAMDSWQYSYYPAWRGHRPQVLHGFHAREPEQVRGDSVLQPIMKSLRDLSDYLDYELVANVITSMFPLFIETSDPAGMAGALSDLPMDGQPAPDAAQQRYHTYEAGQVLYGQINQKPHLLTGNRPGGAFAVFVERLLRAQGAGAGMPYEVFTKDFSKTNYSSARAALLEAWRVFRLYRHWLQNVFCQPLFEMVLEEAWLRGLLDLPATAPDFYDAREDFCSVDWIGPPRGHVDPVKEMQADIAGIDAGVLTLADVVGERGGDWEAKIAQRAREKKALEAAGLASDTQTAGTRLAALPSDPESNQQEATPE